MIIFEMRPLHVRCMTDGLKSTQTLIHQQMDISMTRITAKQMVLTKKVDKVQFFKWCDASRQIFTHFQ